MNILEVTEHWAHGSAYFPSGRLPTCHRPDASDAGSAERTKNVGRWARFISHGVPAHLPVSACASPATSVTGEQKRALCSCPIRNYSHICRGGSAELPLCPTTAGIRPRNGSRGPRKCHPTTLSLETAVWPGQGNGHDHQPALEVRLVDSSPTASQPTSP